MSIGTGLNTGTDTDVLSGLRPGDRDYVDHTGMTFHPQNENNTDGNIPFYEINNQSDQLDFTMEKFIVRFDRPIMVLHPIFGETDFQLVERSTGGTVVDEVSGFGSNVWVFDISATDGKLRLTDFDPSGAVDGTQAGWLAYARVFDAQ